MGASYRAHQTHHAFANCGPTQRPDREILFADTVQHSRQLLQMICRVQFSDPTTFIGLPVCVWVLAAFLSQESALRPTARP